jgi:integrase
MRFDDLDIGALKLPTGRRIRTYSSARATGLTLVLKRGSDRRIRREFHLRYTRPDGTGRTSVLLGTWPDIDADRAVELAGEQRALLKRGIDPATQTRAVRARARQQQMLLGQAVEARYRVTAVAAEWLAEVEEHRRAGTVTKYRQAVSLYLVPEFGGTDIRFFDRAAFERLVRILGKRSRAAAMNLMATTRAMLSWAVEHDRITANPLAGRRTVLEDIRVAPRERTLSSAELHRFVTELDAQPISRDAQVLLRLQLLTGARIGELAGLTWAEVDIRGRVAQVPAARSKAKRDIEVLLSDAARRLLLEWRRETLELGRLRVFREGLDTRAAVDEVRRLQPWLAFASHDIRRTVRTQLQRLGCPLEIRSLISNHSAPAGVAKHYDHAKVRRGQLQWLERWAESLATVAEDPQALEDELDAGDDALLEEFADVL